MRLAKPKLLETAGETGEPGRLPRQMGTARNLAAKLLRAALLLAPEASRDWAEAMLHELDSIDGDWPALFWALGCPTAILRQCWRAWSFWLERAIGILLGIRSLEEEKKMNSTKKDAESVVRSWNRACPGSGSVLSRIRSPKYRHP